MTSIESAPLSEVVAEILENSDNMAAEMLVKELAAKPGVAGTTAAGLAIIEERLRQMAGVGIEEVDAVDGSGLDRSDKTSCSVLQRVVATGPPQLGDGLPSPAATAPFTAASSGRRPPARSGPRPDRWRVWSG